MCYEILKCVNLLGGMGFSVPTSRSHSQPSPVTLLSVLAIPVPPTYTVHTTAYTMAVAMVAVATVVVATVCWLRRRWLWP